MLFQTLCICGVDFIQNPALISWTLEGLYNQNPPLARYTLTWNLAPVFNRFGCFFPKFEEFDIQIGYFTSSV